jgi:hypothetical protein
MLIPRRRLPPDVVNMDELWSTQNLHRNAVNYFKINSEPDTILQDLTIKTRQLLLKSLCCVKFYKFLYSVLNNWAKNIFSGSGFKVLVNNPRLTTLLLTKRRP